ncbi:cytochrome b, partial [Neisseria meningitidis]
MFKNTYELQYFKEGFPICKPYRNPTNPLSRESIMKPDTLQSYGSTTRFLHWTIAACYLFMFATVIAWNIDENLKFLINSHKAVGILLLILSVWRIATVFFTPSGKNTKTQIKPFRYRFRRYRFRQNNHVSG